MDAGDNVLVQVHIPKCAGTSIGNWLRKSFAAMHAGYGQLYVRDLVFETEALWEAGLKNPIARGLSSHSVRLFPAEIHGRRMHYFTILRYPLGHFLSAARYMQQAREAFEIPPGVGPSVQDMTAYLLARPVEAGFRENTQTNHLALYEWCARTGGRCDPTRYGHWSPADQIAYSSERLELAKEILRSFLVVGTLERLQLAMDLLRTRGAAYDFALLPFEQAERLNTTTIPLADVSWIEGTELGSRLLDSVAVDLELYRYGDQLLTEATSGKPPATNGR